MKKYSKTINGLRRYLPTGEYQIVKRVGDHLIQEMTKTTSKQIAEALKAKRILEVRRASGKRNVVEKAPEKLTLRFFLDRYTKTVELSDLEQPTKDKARFYVRSLELHWPEVSEFKETEKATLDVELRALGPMDFAAVRKHWADNFSAYLTNRVVAILRECYRMARGFNPLLGDPLADVPWTREVVARLELPTMEQFGRVLAFLRSRKVNRHSAAVADLVEGLAYTGLRLKEARLLCKDHIQLENGVIALPAEIVKGRKGGRVGREVPILPGTEKFWKCMREKADPQTGRVFKVEKAYWSLDRACKEAGIPYLSHHKLRHLWATLALEKTGNVKLVASWLGHRDGGSLVLKRYAHVRGEYEREQAKKLVFGFGSNQAPIKPKKRKYRRAAPVKSDDAPAA